MAGSKNVVTSTLASRGNKQLHMRAFPAIPPKYSARRRQCSVLVASWNDLAVRDLGLALCIEWVSRRRPLYTVDHASSIVLCHLSGANLDARAAGISSLDRELSR